MPVHTGRTARTRVVHYPKTRGFTPTDPTHGTTPAPPGNSSRATGPGRVRGSGDHLVFADARDRSRDIRWISASADGHLTCPFANQLRTTSFHVYRRNYAATSSPATGFRSGGFHRGDVTSVRDRAEVDHPNRLGTPGMQRRRRQLMRHHHHGAIRGEHARRRVENPCQQALGVGGVEMLGRLVE